MSGKRYFRLLIASFVIVSFMAGPVSMALDSDRGKPLRIRADSVRIDDKNGVSTYKGRVVVVQGSMKITADQLQVIYDKNRNLSRIIAHGNPSTYKQRPDVKKREVYARANRMDYYAQKSELVMKKNASFTQGVNVFKSHKIRYNMKTDYVDATGRRSKKGSSESGVDIIFDRGKK